MKGLSARPHDWAGSSTPECGPVRTDHFRCRLLKRIDLSAAPPLGTLCAERIPGIFGLLSLPPPPSPTHDPPNRARRCGNNPRSRRSSPKVGRWCVPRRRRGTSAAGCICQPGREAGQAQSLPQIARRNKPLNSELASARTGAAGHAEPREVAPPLRYRPEAVGGRQERARQSERKTSAVSPRREGTARRASRACGSHGGREHDGAGRARGGAF